MASHLLYLPQYLKGEIFMKNFMIVTFAFLAISGFSANAFALGNYDGSRIEKVEKQLEADGFKCDWKMANTDWADDSTYTTSTPCENAAGKKILKIVKYEKDGMSRCADVTALSIEINEVK